MKAATIDFSAQFGGKDAAVAVLPHFKALKAAARGIRLIGFPFPKLAFVLRVDGEVSSFGLSGAGDLEIDKNGEYLSVDVGITQVDRDRLYNAMKAALLSAVETIETLEQASSWEMDIHSIRQCLDDLITRYGEELTNPS